MLAASSGSNEIVHILLQAGADVNVQDIVSYMYILHWTICFSVSFLTTGWFYTIDVRCPKWSNRNNQIIA